MTEPTEAEVEAAAKAVWNSKLLQPARGPWPEKQTVTSAFCKAAARAALTAAAQVRERADLLQDHGWQNISTAPKDGTRVRLKFRDIECTGRYRLGQLGEPQQAAIGWRCDCCGRFSNPDGWKTAYPTGVEEPLMPIYGATEDPAEDQGEDVLGMRKGEE